MVAFKAALLWLSTSAYVLALPASNKEAEYKYDINGELLSFGADKRSNSYPGKQQPYPAIPRKRFLP
jgi:hypothetical protein